MAQSSVETKQAINDKAQTCAGRSRLEDLISKQVEVRRRAVAPSMMFAWPES